MISNTASSFSVSPQTANATIAAFGKQTTERSLLDVWNPKKNSIAYVLASEPQAFDFFQAVLLIERIAGRDDASNDSVANQPIGHFSALKKEAVRIAAPSTNAFPTAQIEALTVDRNSQPRMLVNFMGLTGPSGMLPRTYTHLLAQTSRDGRGDERYALRDFLDQFNHRLVSLFFVAWTKYRFPVRISRGEERSLMDVALSASAGLADPKTECPGQQQSKISRNDLLAFAGLLSQHPTTAGNLQAVLHRILHVPVRVHQFQSSVLDLDESSQTCLGVRNGCGELGRSAVVGPRTRTRQHKISIEVGPLSFERLVDFLPGDAAGNSYTQVAELVRRFAGHSMEYELQVKISSMDVPGCRLESFEQQDDPNANGSRLGFDSWLESDMFPEILEDAVIPGQ